MIATALVTVGAILIAANYVGIAFWVRKKMNYSCIPVLGGLLASVGFLFIPALRLFAWLPPLIDPGCAPMLVMSIVNYGKRYKEL
jgi:hypothetical protein